MPKQDFLRIMDLTPDEISSLYDLAARMKSGAYRDRPLDGKTLAMVFAKSSTRTRVSFEVGAYELGGHGLFLSGRDLQLGRGETIGDTARVLSRYVDGIMIRTFAQSDVDELASAATVPVINGLTDSLPPCQVLSDVFTMWEVFGGWRGRIVAWVGDGNNMANSWLNAAALLGFELRLACPEAYEPDHEMFERAQGETKVAMLEDPDEAVQGAHVVYTDVWASMGQEQDAEARRLAFKGYEVDSDLMKHAAADAIFLHCLPAHRGEEVTAEVMDGPQSRVFDQAENRLHVQKALMATLMGGKDRR
jgi:ornithine carbamoyltransferase